MKVIIDTSSLISLVKYYLSFDSSNKLYDLVKKQIENYDIIIIDEVLRECEITAKKIVIKKLLYLGDKFFLKKLKLPIKTADLIPPAPKKFYNLVDNNFITPYARRLDSAEFEQRKKEYLNSADARMIIFTLNQLHNYPNERFIIVTEESETGNDQKEFKKIPAICKIINIEVMTLPDLLKLYKDQINMTFS